ncbi:hypothetical protein, partial [Acinetobacter baumannii]|uniref:hypothetical protein n=1 Tax=Acinetobacter baumannii TaxID=470 RepID=UPI002076E222
MQNFILIQFNFFILMNELIYIFEIVIRIINLTFNIKLFKNNNYLKRNKLFIEKISCICRIFCTKINQFSSGGDGKSFFSSTRVTNN